MNNDLKQRRIRISQRRYLGSKTGLVDLIAEVMEKEIGEFGSLCDIFAGTGVVGSYFNNEAVEIIANDILFSNYVTSYAWLSDEPYDEVAVAKLIEELDALNPTEENYVSKNFGNKYFTVENAKKIGAIRERIEELELNFREKSILLTSLIYAMDKVANTVGHYDAYRETLDTRCSLRLSLPEIDNHKNVGNLVFNQDANRLIRHIRCDVLYLDPPYNSRQYCDTYHLLENIARWKKPELKGKARKFDRTGLKSEYNSVRATKAFADLISHADCSYILLSYNNMGAK